MMKPLRDLHASAHRRLMAVVPAVAMAASVGWAAEGSPLVQQVVPAYGMRYDVPYTVPNRLTAELSEARAFLATLNTKLLTSGAVAADLESIVFRQAVLARAVAALPTQMSPAERQAHDAVSLELERTAESLASLTAKPVPPVPVMAPASAVESAPAAAPAMVEAPVMAPVVEPVSVPPSTFTPMAVDAPATDMPAVETQAVEVQATEVVESAVEPVMTEMQAAVESVEAPVMEAPVVEAPASEMAPMETVEAVSSDVQAAMGEATTGEAATVDTPAEVPADVPTEVPAMESTGGMEAAPAEVTPVETPAP